MFALLAVEEFLLSCSLIQYGNYICRFFITSAAFCVQCQCIEKFQIVEMSMLLLSVQFKCAYCVA